MVFMISCQPDPIDVEVIDSPPAITIKSPGNFVLEGNFNLTVDFVDGFKEELSRSPLASATFSVMRSDSLTVVPSGSGNFTVTGIKTAINQVFTNTLAPGIYFFNVSATDTKGNITKAYKKFEIIKDFDTIGIIGTATPGGWATDTDMTRDSGNPALWVINSITLVAGEAKFRANDAWTVNWGANAFPTGTGTQDGPNIPVPAGTYKVTLNITTGEYKFQ